MSIVVCQRAGDPLLRRDELLKGGTGHRNTENRAARHRPKRKSARPDKSGGHFSYIRILPGVPHAYAPSAEAFSHLFEPVAALLKRISCPRNGRSRRPGIQVASFLLYLPYETYKFPHTTHSILIHLYHVDNFSLIWYRFPI